MLKRKTKRWLDFKSSTNNHTILHLPQTLLVLSVFKRVERINGLSILVKASSGTIIRRVDNANE